MRRAGSGGKHGLTVAIMMEPERKSANDVREAARGTSASRLDRRSPRP
jgi:hypothetical protein